MVWYLRQREQYVMNPVLSDVIGPVVMYNHSVYGGCLVWSWMSNFLDSYYLLSLLASSFLQVW